jgi:hypothetical protein
VLTKEAEMNGQVIDWLTEMTWASLMLSSGRYVDCIEALNGLVFPKLNLSHAVSTAEPANEANDGPRFRTDVAMYELENIEQGDPGYALGLLGVSQLHSPCEHCQLHSP